jgi:acetyl-CoA carboxylase beta subunit
VSRSHSTPLCRSCHRPLVEEELELNGAKCNDCDHYETTLARELTDDELDEMDRRCGSL